MKLRYNPTTPSGIGIGSVISVTSYGATGNGTTDDTAAINAAIAVAVAAGGGTVFFPEPSNTYRVSSTISVTGPHITLLGPGNGGTLAKIWLTMDASQYGTPIFNCTGDNVSVVNLSGQYGPSTTLSAPVTAGASSVTFTTITMPVGGNVIPGDTFLIGQYPNIEQFIVLSLAGNVVSLAVSNSFTQSGGVGNPYSWVAGTAAQNHSAGEWIRLKAQVGLSTSINGGVGLYGEPQRDSTGFLVFANGNYCRVENCAVEGMNTGVKWQGVYPGNTNNHHNTTDGFMVDNQDQGILSKCQDFPTMCNVRGTNISLSQDGHADATTGTTRAPAHVIYNTGTTSQLTNYLTAYNIQVQGNQVAADCSPVKFKYCNYSTIWGMAFEACTRFADIENFFYSTFSNFSCGKLILTEVADSQAAGISVVDGHYSLICNGDVTMLQADGASGVDIPAVYVRSSDGSVLNTHCTVSDVVANTNYSTNFASLSAECMKAEGATYTTFRDCKIYDSGSATNWYYFGFAYNSTLSVGSDYSCLVEPRCVGTNAKVAYISATNTGVILSGDPNLLPASFTVTDSGTGTVSNLSGLVTLTLNPTSTSANIITVNEPASYQGYLMRFLNSGSVTEFAVIDNASGNNGQTNMNLWSSGAFAALLVAGYNSTAGYPASGATYAGFVPTQNGSTGGTSGAGILWRSAELQNSGAKGVDLRFNTVLAGSTTQQLVCTMFNNADITLGLTAPATNATVGLPYLPAMAGIPTGSIAGRSGFTPIVYDTTDNILWANRGSTNWYAINAQQVFSGLSNNSNLTPNSMYRAGSADNGNALFLPNATTCKGSCVTFKQTNSGGSYTITIKSNGGTVENIAAATGYSFASVSAFASVTFQSDGTNWWLVAKV